MLKLQGALPEDSLVDFDLEIDLRKCNVFAQKYTGYRSGEVWFTPVSGRDVEGLYDISITLTDSNGLTSTYEVGILLREALE